MKHNSSLRWAIRPYCFLLLLPLFICYTSFSQSIPVTGKVVDNNNTPLSGVSVVVKETQAGTATDKNGDFTIQAAIGNTLVFSSAEYTARELRIANADAMTISLETTKGNLNEVVVISYGTQKRKMLTGAVATLPAKQLEDQLAGQFAQKIQGRLAGVQINQTSGTPGGGMSFRIRGAASVNAGNGPLFVVDGFPINGNINAINPSEIESFSVLKDAAATALYGSRASNGVILITTKKARAGQSQVQLSASYGFAQVPKKGRPDLMNAQEHAEYMKGIFEDRAKYEGYTGGVPELYQNPEKYAGKGTDWYDLLLRKNAPTKDINFSVAMNKDKFSSSLTAGYFDQDGSMVNTYFRRFSLRFNGEYKLNDFIIVGGNVAPSYQTNQNFNSDGIQQLLANAVTTSPILSPFNADGSLKINLTGPGLLTQPNYYRVLRERVNIGKSTRLLANVYAEINFLKDFRFRTAVSTDLVSGNGRSYIASTSGSGSIFGPPPVIASGSYSASFTTSWLTENTLTYNKTIKDHSVEVLAGYTAQKVQGESTSASGTNFPDDAIPWLDAAGTRNAGGNGPAAYSILSVLGRVTYNFKERYLFTASVRRDGSSRFGATNRWATFPAVSAGWIISDEKFAQNIPVISFLKLRGSYGLTGNFNIGNYTQYGNVSSSNAVLNNTIASGRAPVSLANTELTWETSSMADIGLEVGLLKDRLFLTVDYYTKKTDDLLYQVDIPAASGFGNVQSNVGEFKFWGTEFSLASKNLVGEFKWNSDFNISFHRNKVIKLGTNNTPIGGIGEQGYESYWRTAVGRPIGQFWGYVQDGVYMNQEDFDKSPKNATYSAVGTVKFRDLNKDGVITQADRQEIGNPTPKFVFGFANNFEYKNFDFTIVMSGAYGGDLINAQLEWLETLEGIFNVNKYIKDRWRSPENPGAGIIGRSLTGTTAYPRNTNSRWITDGSYLTIKNITLGYQLPAAWFKKYISRARIYAGIQQALVITKYKGANPEVSNQGLNGLNEGADGHAYPVPRTFAFGINVNF